ncbi:MAG: response regulator [Eubacteriales bacterium]|nr:response regulator [Eubacteriales bacterium]
MHRILIADDDMIVRMYLRDVIRWESYGFTVVGTARDGEEALEMVHREQPDVLLTDISMPRMNGIELIHQLREEEYDGVINVLSCHDDFELVKSAMQQGADDYLLKNYLSDTTMEEILDRLREQIQARNCKSDQRDEIKKLARKGIDVIRRELLESILRGELTPETREQRLKQAKLHGAYRKLAAVMLQPSEADWEQRNELLALCTQRLESEAADILMLHENTMVLLIDLGDTPSMAQCMETIRRLEQMLGRLAEQYLNLELSMAASAVCEGENAIADALRQANETLQNRFYGAGQWQYGPESRMTQEIPAPAERFRAELVEMLRDGKEDRIRNRYAEALDAMREARVYAGTVLSWLRQCDHIAGIRRTENQYSAMTRFTDYLGCAEEYIVHSRTSRLHAVPQNISATMRTAVTFLQEHFHEPIGLNDIARQAGLSPAYFSTLFKQEMGMGFSEYLLSLRLERVCAGLRTTEQTIKQISEEAGFADYSYFCRIFKKNLGLSPAAYRKKTEN